MSIWGKVVGGVGGFMIGGALGAVLGATVGHGYDRMRSEGKSVFGPDEGVRWGSAFKKANDAARQLTFTVAIVTLSAKMAKADGEVSEIEVETFKRCFGIPPEEMPKVEKLFRAASASPDGFEVYARQVARMFGDSPQMLEELLGALVMIAHADGRLHPAEITYLRRVAEIFGLPPRDFERVRATHSTGAADPYEILGVTPEMDTASIKAAYRKLVRENHPDMLIAQGMPPDFVDMANRKLATINTAWDSICRLRGIK